MRVKKEEENILKLYQFENFNFLEISFAIQIFQKISRNDRKQSLQKLTISMEWEKRCIQIKFNNTIAYKVFL